MLRILPENPEVHADDIEALYDITFGPGHFAKTAERLREHNSSIPELNRIATTARGIVVGAVRVWPIAAGTGGRLLFVGPVAVHPDARGEKLGLELCEASMKAAAGLGWPGALIIGAPSYFSELGFVTIKPGQFIFPGPQDMNRVMWRNLSGNISQFSGKIIAHRLKTSGGQFT